MYSSIQKLGDTYFVALKPGVKGNGPGKKLTHGRVTFDTQAKTVQFSDSTPLPLPGFDEIVREGATIPFALMGGEGKPRKQRRDVVVQKSKDGQLYMPGVAQTPSTRSAEEGWRVRVYKFRAFFTHPGIETEAPEGSNSAPLPQWLRDSIERQRRYRNKLVSLCNEARAACRPVDYEAFITFLNETVLPAIDRFNDQCGRANAKAKIKADKLRKENPSIFHLTRFAGYLQYLEKEGKPVPEGLAKTIFDFAKELPLDFSPINEFQRNLVKVFERERYLEDVSLIKETDKDGNVRERTQYRRLTDRDEIEKRAAELRLRDWECKPVASGFSTTLKNRRSKGMSFFEGWPRFTKPNPQEWGIHFYFNGACDASDLLTKGLRGLKLGNAVDPDETGRHWKHGSRKGQRSLHPAEISFRDQLSGGQFRFRFALLRHKFPWPDGSVIKEWKLIRNRSGLWLCLVVQGKFAKPVLNSGETGAVHIGWRKNGAEIQPAILYDPTAKGREAFRRVIVDEELPPERSDRRTPFRLNMGPSRWGRSSLIWVTVKNNTPVLRAEPHSPDAVQIQDTWYGLDLLRRWRDDRKDLFKGLLLSKLDPTPAGLQKAGAQMLHQIGKELLDPDLTAAYKAWAQEDAFIYLWISRISLRVAARLEDGYNKIAHDICKHFVSRGITTIAVQDSLVAKVSKKKGRKESDAEQAILDASQRNRQHVAPALLLSKVVNVSDAYGLGIVRVANTNISRKHNDRGGKCDHINPPSLNQVIVCEACLKEYDQDENAGINMVEAARLIPPTPGDNEMHDEAA